MEGESESERDLILWIAVYISGRPFVLRDASEPRKTLALSDRAENLEAIELRLKNDILQEAARYVHLFLYSSWHRTRLIWFVDAGSGDWC